MEIFGIVLAIAAIFGLALTFVNEVCRLRRLRSLRRDWRSYNEGDDE
jgi:hypothetical protein